MAQIRSRPTAVALATALALLAPGSASALDPRQQTAALLPAKAFFRPELSVSMSHVRAESLREALAARQPAWSRLLHVAGPGAEIYLDPRSGAPTSIIASIPMIPGSGIGNTLTLEALESALRRPVSGVDPSLVADLVTRFITDHGAALGVDPTHVGSVQAAQVTPELWHVRVGREVDGVAVRHAHMVATLSHGNMVLFGTEMWGSVRIDTSPGITADQALEIGFGYVGGKHSTDELWQEPRLEIVPFAPPQYQDGPAFAGPIGEGYAHYLVWAFGFRREGEIERWELLVDAHDGTVLAFEDRNHYDSSRIKGGVYPLTNTEICPTNATCGVMQSGEPMPYADTGLPAPNDFTNAAGVYDLSGGPATTSLNGRYVRMTDTCGPISESAATGDLDLGGANGQHDCASGGTSAGNTAASRSGFYELNKLIEVARGWLPSNPWLDVQITSNMNLFQTCNAYYDYSTINFFQSGGGCRNTGELAAVFDHEWGHALDDNDSGGELSSSSEAYADIAAIYRLRASCVGHGFFWTVDGGCGMTADGTGFNANESQSGTYCTTDCSGVRDADWGKHVSEVPATALGFVCTHCWGGDGPCGAQVHCAAAPSRQAAWDLVARDLQAPPFNMTRDDAFNLGSKLFFQGSGNIGSWHACTCGVSSDGCGATNAYLQWLAADDDDGNLANGTPHMTAIFAAFDRHGIACAAPTPVNGGCAGGPTTAPVVTASIGTNQLGLAWSAVPGASSYRILRTEGYAGCDFSKAVVGEVAGTSFTDVAVVNDRPYHYVVQAVGASGACIGPGSECLTAVPLACAGVAFPDRQAYKCADVIGLHLADSDLIGAGSQAVAVSSTVEATPEVVTLVESPPASGRFSGTIETTSGPAAPDGRISVVHGGSVSVQYTDALACGIPDVTVERTAAIDCLPPSISGVSVTVITGSSAVVHWVTDEPGDSRVTWGVTSPPTTSIVVTANTTTHDVPLANLTPCARHYFSVETRDPAGNVATDNAGGTYYTFTTPHAYGVACSLGSIAFDRGSYNCNSDLISVTLADTDLDLDPDALDTVDIPVTSSSETTPEVVTLVESYNPGTFYGTIPMAPLPVVPGDGVIQTGHLDVLTATYQDADTGLGGPATVTTLAWTDCAPPAISNIHVTPLPYDSVQIDWTTSKPTYGYVEFGPTTAYDGIAYDSGWDPIQHVAILSPLSACEPTFFRVVAFDDFGWTATADNGGAGYQFNAWTLPALYKQDFEGSHGWTLTGEWQVAPPQGLGGDRPDPTSAEHGAKVLGVDLTGLGAHPGDYEEGSEDEATSPVIDASTLLNTTVRFRQWLNTDPGAAAMLEVFDALADDWIEIFSIEDGSYSWGDWQIVEHDISAYADGNSQLQLRFVQQGGDPGTNPQSGWNIDRLEVRDGSVTTPEACGDCTGVPSFGGLVSAADLDGCAATGILLAWEPATAWGTGAAGTYSVYRDTSPSFLPSSANRIATGLVASTFADASAPADTTLYYLVRAESDETCGGGPNNGGVTETNLLRRIARDETTQPAPGTVGNTLQVSLVNSAHVRLAWAASPGAVSYRVLRAAGPAGSFQPVADVNGTVFEDLNRAMVNVPDYYLIHGLDSCGNDGP